LCSCLTSMKKYAGAPDTGGLSSSALCFHHISNLAADVEVTKEFYVRVLGFQEVRRPASFEFDGCWCGSPWSFMVLRCCAGEIASLLRRGEGVSGLCRSLRNACCSGVQCTLPWVIRGTHEFRL
jgi:hypothetical protein